MAHSFKNDDGTVNMDGLKGHMDFVKGKYAQNAKNYEANTGKSMTMGEGNANEIKGQMAAKEEEPTTTAEQKEADEKS